MDVAEDICNIVENASKYILNETDDWFDAMSVKRNLKKLKLSQKNFIKLQVNVKFTHNVCRVCMKIWETY